MPQFDFTTYSSQIFWFALCFVILYLFSHSIILPRIKLILTKRHDSIEDENILAKELSRKVDMITFEAEQNFQTANSEYFRKIDEITKNSNLERDKSIDNLKHEIDIKIKKSRSEIKSFVEGSKNNNQIIIQNLIHLIKNKIIN